MSEKKIEDSARFMGAVICCGFLCAMFLPIMAIAVTVGAVHHGCIGASKAIREAFVSWVQTCDEIWNEMTK